MSDNWIDAAGDIRQESKFDVDALRKYLAGIRPEWDNDLSVKQFPGGHSNLTFQIDVAGDEIVLRHPPRGIKIKSGHDMGREYRVMSHLHPVFKKVPEPYFFCEDESIIGVPFYGMQRVRGIIMRKRLPKDMPRDEKTISTIAQTFINTLVELHAVDYKAAGLAELGRPEGYIERQVHGWTKRYRAVQTGEVKEIEELIKWLADNIISESGHSLIHNDYKFDNIVYSAEDWSQILALLDWEMATLGDPLMDLGTSLALWVRPQDADDVTKMTMIPPTISGAFTRAELVEMYLKRSGGKDGDFVFYFAVSLLKMAVVIQQLYYRYKIGKSDDKRLTHFGDTARLLCGLALQSIAKKRLDDLF